MADRRVKGGFKTLKKEDLPKPGFYPCLGYRKFQPVPTVVYRVSVLKGEHNSKLSASPIFDQHPPSHSARIYTQLGHLLLLTNYLGEKQY